MDEFIPDTFCMNVKDERDAFFSQQEGITVTAISSFLSICVAAWDTLKLVKYRHLLYLSSTSRFLGLQHSLLHVPQFKVKLEHFKTPKKCPFKYKPHLHLCTQLISVHTGGKRICLITTFLLIPGFI